MVEAVKLLQALVKCKSITPESNGSIELCENTLKRLGFVTEIIEFTDTNSYPVKNLYAKIGTGDKVLGFCGHLDVVPEGKLDLWQVNPFAGEIVNDTMVGRGVEDMKGGVACFIAALNKFLPTVDLSKIAIVVLLTLDEEQVAINGVIKLIKHVVEVKKQTIDDCLLGEPTCINYVGDNIKIGRRGSLNYVITVNGKQGHVAYPHLFNNPIKVATQILQDLKELKLSEANEFYEASNLEITDINTSSHKFNVVPANVKIKGNIRFNNQHNIEELQAKLTQVVAKYPNIDIEFTKDASEAFKAATTSKIFKNLHDAIVKVIGKKPQFDTNGGTSDARHLKNYTNIVEFGLIEKTLHQVNEGAKVKDIYTLTDIYQEFLSEYFK